MISSQQLNIRVTKENCNSRFKKEAYTSNYEVMRHFLIRQKLIGQRE